jgi:hypothetical protein
MGGGLDPVEVEALDPGHVVEDRGELCLHADAFVGREVKTGQTGYVIDCRSVYSHGASILEGSSL